VKLVGAVFGDHVDDATRKTAIFCIVGIGLNFEFLDGVRVGQDIAGISKVGHVDAAIEVVVHRARSAVGAAVDQCSLFGIAKNKRTRPGGCGCNAVIVGLHTRCQIKERINIALDKRKIFESNARKVYPRISKKLT